MSDSVTSVTNSRGSVFIRFDWMGDLLTTSGSSAPFSVDDEGNDSGSGGEEEEDG